MRLAIALIALAGIAVYALQSGGTTTAPKRPQSVTLAPADRDQQAAADWVRRTVGESAELLRWDGPKVGDGQRFIGVQYSTNSGPRWAYLRLDGAIAVPAAVESWHSLKYESFERGNHAPRIHAR